MNFGLYIRSSDNRIARIDVDEMNQTNFHPEYNPDTKENDFAVITVRMLFVLERTFSRHWNVPLKQG